jgi:Ca2+-binding EF-hand superfamily protein
MALANQSDFNLPETFAFFSANQLSRLSQFDLVQGLQRLGVKVEDEDAVLLKERYDADQDGKLGYWEFAALFLPIEPMLRDSVERRQQERQMSRETLERLTKLLMVAVEFEATMEGIR